MMFKEIIIFDDFIDDGRVSHIERLITKEAEDISWKFSTYTSVRDPDSAVAVEDSMTYHAHQMVHPIGPDSPLYNDVMSAFFTFTDRAKIKVNKVLRAKANILSRTTPDNINKYHVAHVDTNAPHKVFLYYVNTCDGDTVLFNESYTGKPIESLSVASRIDPKAGRGIIFDGGQFHASSSPVASEYRIVINIDFVEEG
jgi:hypothetical protein